MNVPIKWVLFLVVPVLAMLAWLSYGDPQNGKVSYMWQAYVWPEEVIIWK